MKAFIFDLDGVLVFTDKFHYQAWKAMADRMGISQSDISRLEKRIMTRLKKEMIKLM